jgi:predicted RNase H-like HicB family nuclease
MDGERRTLVFGQKRDGWIGYAPALPGTNAQGSTLEEVRENLSAAVRLASRTEREQVYHVTRTKDMLAVPQRSVE